MPKENDWYKDKVKALFISLLMRNAQLKELKTKMFRKTKAIKIRVMKEE